MLIFNATLATLNTADGYGIIENGALVTDNGQIQWIGKSADLPAAARAEADQYDCAGKLITPGLIDCHTHLVYAGDRAGEFELRLQGASYEEIATQGGGILSTVYATRDASEQELIFQSSRRLRRLISEGVTTFEIKSGYGLDTENEIKMLSVAKKLAAVFQVRVEKTFLAAHALPPEFSGKKEQYIDLVCEQMLPAAHAENLVDAVDGFCEGIAFSVAQIERVFDTAQSLNLPIKLHAEQLSDLGGAKMAAQRGALSVDHLEYLAQTDVEYLARSGTVAVLLPGAFYFLKEKKLPPMASLRSHNVPIAIATDCNPGSSPMTSLLLSMNMACIYFSLTPSEALRGVTINAAKALGLEHLVGSLEPGKQADLVVWDTDNPASLSYHIGLNPCHRVMVAGQWRTCAPNSEQQP